MNTRMRIKAIPALLAASVGSPAIGEINRVIAHEGHKHAAQVAVPEGIEQIEIALTETGVTGMPETIAAGRYLVKLSAPELTPEMGLAGVSFIQLPEDLTPQEAYEQAITSEDGIAPWAWDAHWGGGVALMNGPESWGVIEFTSGSWVVTALFGRTLGIPFEVTGDFPANAPTPDASVVLHLAEMVITTAEGAFVAGENLVEVDNMGAAVHFVEFSKVPDGTTRAQIEGMLNGAMSGTPVPDALGFDQMVPAALITDMSGGTRQWAPITLEAGTYFLTCWVGDRETMMPHAMMGMWDLITVA